MTSPPALRRGPFRGLPRQGGTLVAMYQMADDTGAVAGPVAAGFLADSVSYSAAFGLAAAVLGLAALAGLFAPETRSRQLMRPPDQP